MRQLYLIGGPNGAGKTTSAFSLLPSLLYCEEYINADSIAAGLSPFRPETMAIQAGRLMLERIHLLASQHKDFAFETTMASRSFVPFLKKCKSDNYFVTLLFLWLKNPELAIMRVASRVNSGGHPVPEAFIRRRYFAGIKNFMNLYLPIGDRWAFYDNSEAEPVLVVSGTREGIMDICLPTIWNKAQEMAR
jgi:predicted ABC-type ATPase